MLSTNGFIKGSLETHLFFARIMKEHSFFLQVGFTPRDTGYIQHANMIRMEFDKLLLAVVNLSNGIISPSVIQSGEIVTPFTVKAEEASSFYTGVIIPTNISKMEMQLKGGCNKIHDPRLEQDIYMLNQQAICLITDLIDFKENILENVYACKMFTLNYPLLIEHILKEAKLYLTTVEHLQRKEDMNMKQETYEQEAFWNQRMAEHSEFIRGLLDPTEEQLMSLANDFSHEFDDLTKDVIMAMNNSLPLGNINKENLEAAERIRDFNTQATVGMIDCKIKSIMLPLLGDHVLRESNHLIRLLNKFSALE